MRAGAKPVTGADPPLSHRLADLLPLLDGAEFEALVEDIRAHGLRQPIVLFDGKVLDGRNRLSACQIACIEHRFTEFHGSEEDALAFVLSMNLARRHLTVAQRAAIAVKLLPYEQTRAQGRRRDAAKGRQNFAGAEGRATEVAGRRVGVSGENVRIAAMLGEQAPDVLYAIEEGTVKSMPEAMKLARMKPERRKEALSKMRDQGARLRDVDSGGSDYWQRPGVSYEWYTPPEILQSARIAMGGDITLDPASSPEAQVNVQAKRFYTAKDDGLTKPWKAARIWCNPPFGSDGDGSSRLGKWVAKLLEEHEAGHVKQGIILLRASTNALWFQPLWAFPMCFMRGRPPYVPGPGVPRDSPSIPTVLVGLGVAPERFAEAFKEFGQVVLPDCGGFGRSMGSCGSR